MKRLLYVILVSLIGYLCYAFLFNKEEKANELLSIGDKAPLSNYSMLDISGDSTSLNQAKKEMGLVVVFSCNTCPFVIAWEDRYQTIDSLCNKLNVGMIAINSNEAKRDGDDSFEKMKTHAKEYGYNFPYTVDNKSKLAKAFGATKTPQIFLFNKELTLVYTGAIDDNYKDVNSAENHYLTNALNNLANGKIIDPETSTALGCSIKKVK